MLSMKKSKVIGYENINLKGWDGPPYSYSVTINGKKKVMSGFDEQHIRDQIHPRKATRIIKFNEAGVV